MLRLDLKTGPRWIDLGNGVRFEVMPFTTRILLDAQLGLRDGADDPDATLPEGRSAESQIAFAKAVARAAVIGWEGVVDARDKPVPVDGDAIAATLDHVWVFTAFQREYINPGMLQADEGNGSAPSPNGNSAAARTTARTARPSAGNARARKTGR